MSLKINVATSEENAIKQKDELNKPKESKQSEKNELDKKLLHLNLKLLKIKKNLSR